MQAAAQAKQKPLTIADLEASRSSSVWVLNNTAPKGNVNMTMSDGQGQMIVVSVPVTWIPIDLTTQATKNAILTSPTFRRMITMGMLKLVDEDTAMTTMAGSDAQKEAQRIYSRAQELTVDEVGMPAEAKAAVAEGDGSISGFALNLANAKDMDEDQVLTTLRNNESSMSPADFRYIAENSQYPRVKARAAEMLVR